MTLQTMKLGVLHREAPIERVDGQNNVFRATYTTGAAGTRRMDNLGTFIEELSMDPAHIRTGRLDAGIVPILLDHRQSVETTYGRVVRHWFENGTGKIEFVMETGTPSADAVLNKLNQGIITTLSVGYKVHKYIRTAAPPDGIPTLLAVDYEPMEISLTPVPFDAGAVIGREAQATECILEVEDDAPTDTPTPELTTERSSDMTTPVIPAPTDHNVDAVRAAELESARAAAAADALAGERARHAAIVDVVRKVNLDQSFADTLIANGTSIDQARALVIDEVAKKDSKTEIRSNIQVGESYDAPAVVRAAIVDSLAHKIDPTIKIEGKALELRSHTMLDCFVEHEAANGRSVPRSREQIAERAMQGTSDFPIILGEASNRVILNQYQKAPSSFRTIARQRNFKDFRPHYMLRSGEFPALQDLSEHGEIKSASLKDATQESITLRTKAIRLGITRQLMVNDDLGMISDLLGGYGARIAAQENALAWAAIRANRALSDGVAVFHANHKNLYGSVVASPDATALGAGRAMMKRHKSDGIALNLSPKYLVVPTDLEVDAEKLMTAILATTTGDVNVFSGKLQIICDAELDEHDAWYLFADPAMAEVLTFGFLNGQSGPLIQTREGWTTDGAEMRLRHDFGVDTTGEKGGVKFKTKN
jgi:phage major head subunit gpT-like protein